MMWHSYDQDHIAHQVHLVCAVSEIQPIISVSVLLLPMMTKKKSYTTEMRRYTVKHFM